MSAIPKALALWHDSASGSLLREVALSPDQVRIESIYSLISIGTERLVATGKVPEEAYQVMRVPYMLGSFDFPCTYGYSLVGSVRNTDQLVHVMHPHQDQVSVADSDLFYLPAMDAPPSRFALLSNMETAVTILWDAEPHPGESVLILGAGLIGLLTASLLARENISFELEDINENRAWKAKMLGFNAKGSRNSYDLIIDTTGNPKALQYAIDHTRKNGRIIVAGWMGSQQSNLLLGGAFHYNRLTIKSSQVSSIPSHKQAEWNFEERKKLCIHHLKNDFYDRLIDHVVDFQDLPQEFDRIRKGDYPYLSLIVKY